MNTLRFGLGLRILPLITAIGLGMGSGVAGATTTLSSIKINSGADQYTCTLGGFMVSGGVVSATVTGCTPALASGGGEAGGGESGGSAPGGSAPEGGAPEGSVGGADPGSGTWSPNLSATPRVVVVDQSGGAKDAVTVVPGCVNGGSIANDSACSKLSEYRTSINGEAVSVTIVPGQILAVRYPLSAAPGALSSTGSIRLTNSIGGAIGVDTAISLSPIPGDMTGNGRSLCTNRSTMTPSVATGTARFSCVVDRTKSVYYLNIAVQQACSGSNCVFYVAEGSSEFR